MVVGERIANALILVLLLFGIYPFCVRYPDWVLIAVLGLAGVIGLWYIYHDPPGHLTFTRFEGIRFTKYIYEPNIICAVEDVTIAPGQTLNIPCRTEVKLSNKVFGIVLPHVELLKRGVMPFGGSLPVGYSGEIIVVATNTSPDTVEIKKGEEIAIFTVVSANKIID